MSKVKMLLDVVQDLRNLTDSLETLAQAMTGTPDGAQASETPQGKPAGEDSANSSTVPVAENPGLSIVELRAFVAERSTPENRPKIKAILERHGVRKLTELQESQYAAVMSEVAALCWISLTAPAPTPRSAPHPPTAG